MLKAVKSGAVVCILTALGACAGGGGGTPEITWPPEQPRQPERLVVTTPDIADPPEWWRVNIHGSLPAGIYDRMAYRDLAQDLIESTNRVRIQHGLEPIEEVTALNRVAQAHSVDQATRDYWSHWTPEGLSSHDRINAATSVTVSAGGENSSIGLTGQESAASVVNGWLTHEGHRELLLDPDVRYMGAGIYQYSSDEPLYFVQLLVNY